MLLTIIESPYAGNIELNIAYVRAAMRHSLSLGESPFASHALYTQADVLDDTIPAERTLGIEAGFAWGAKADMVCFYIDRGWSRGMNLGLEQAVTLGKAEIRTRTLGAPWSDLAPSDAKMVF